MFRVLVLVGMMVLKGLAFDFSFDHNKEDLQYLSLVHAIKDTVITTQKTRGLTNNYMNGNVVAQLLVYGQRENMMKNFETVKGSFSHLGLPSELKIVSEDLINRTKELNRRAFKSNSAEVFGSYSHIIEAWISLNKEVINTHFAKGDQTKYKMVSTLNSVLLPLTENIGKMRGMGSGIVARTYCKRQEIPKMRQFANEIDRYRVLLEYYLKQEAFSALSTQELELINAGLHEYTELTLQKVIAQRDIALDTNSYFNQGTAAISNVLKVYNALVAKLEKS